MRFSRGLARPRATRVALAATTAIACFLASGTAASAGSDSETLKKRQAALNSEITQLKANLGETSTALSTAYLALKQTEAQLPAAQSALLEAQAEQVAAQERSDAAAADYEMAKAVEAKAEDDLAKTTKDIADTRKRVAQFAAQIYQEQGMGQLDVALTSQTPEQFADRLAMMDTVMDVQGASMSRLSTARAAQTATEAHVSALRAESAAAKQRADDALAQAAAARQQAADAKATLDALAATQRSQTAAFTAKLNSEKSELAALQTESQRITSELAARAAAARAAAAKAAAAAAAAAAAKAKANGGKPGGGTTTPTGPVAPTPQGSGVLTFPVPGYHFGSPFGLRFHPILHYWRLHAGADVGAPCGTPVVAAGSGTIIHAGWSGGYGNSIWVDHGILRGVNLVTTYNHLQSITASGHVSRGQVIGYVGTTGLSTGCHLHFETRENGTPVNPVNWL